jgi:DNA-binding ferritin-like protein
MPQDQPVLDEGGQAQTVALLNMQIAAASEVFVQMIHSSRHVAGVDFIMLDHSCDRIARLMDRCCALISERVLSLGGNADWAAQFPTDQTPEHTRPMSALKVADDAFYAATLEALCQSLLDAATLAERQGDGPTSDLLTRVWREVDRGLRQMIPQDSVEVHLYLSVDGAANR